MRYRGQQLLGPVGGAVVDDDDLEGGTGAEPHDRQQAFEGQPEAVEDRNDDRDLRGGLVSQHDPARLCLQVVRGQPNDRGRRDLQMLDAHRLQLQGVGNERIVRADRRLDVPGAWWHRRRMRSARRPPLRRSDTQKVHQRVLAGRFQARVRIQIEGRVEPGIRVTPLLRPVQYEMEQWVHVLASNVRVLRQIERRIE